MPPVFPPDSEASAQEHTVARGPLPARGLSDQAAAERLATEGPNELPQPRRRGWWRIAGEIIREPMVQLLLAAGLVYLALGDRAEAAMLLAFVLITVAITLVQERRTERVLEALRDLSSPRALVLRGGQRLRVAGRELVRGDLIFLAEGDRVPADALLRCAAEAAINLALGLR